MNPSLKAPGSHPAGSSAQPRLFHGRLAVQQRVLPAYRAPFFDALARLCTGGLVVLAGLPLPDEQIVPAETLTAAGLIRLQNRHWMKVSSPFYQCRQKGFLEALEQAQPEALIVEANPRYRSTPAAVRWMHRRGRPVLGWGLGAPPLLGLLAGWRSRGRRSFLAALDGVIAYSRSGAEEYRQMGFSPERVFVAPNAAAGKPSAPPPERSSQPGQPLTVVFVGRLQARKRIDLLLQACAALPEDIQPKVCIVGDGPARADFEFAARSFYPRAEFTGALFGEQLAATFSRADLFVLPGTGGLAVQQAMSYALPVLVAEGDGTQSDLVRPENGWSIPPDNLVELTAALREALSDPLRLRCMGAESYRIVAEEINVEAMAACFVEAVVRVSEAVGKV